MKILITGGLGYIGSNITLELLKKNFTVIVIDNLCNSSKKIIKNIKYLSKKNFTFVKADCKNKNKIFKIFNKYKPNVVIHLAGLKSVSESMNNPNLYFRENIISALNIFEAMNKHKVNNLIFSSSATVYGKPQYLPLDENHVTEPQNPYGSTKLIIEKHLLEICKFNKNWSVLALRYFNPVGSDPSGILSDNPKLPNNLFPKIYEFISGKLKFLPIYGTNYKSKDGTAIRDYIHILDLVDCHIDCIKYLKQNKGFQVFNVGTGNGLTVNEIIKNFEKINKIRIKLKSKKRRAGDVPAVYAGVKKIKKLMGWKSKLSINEMCLIKK